MVRPGIERYQNPIEVWRFEESGLEIWLRWEGKGSSDSRVTLPKATGCFTKSAGVIPEESKL